MKNGIIAALTFPKVCEIWEIPATRNVDFRGYFESGPAVSRKGSSWRSQFSHPEGWRGWVIGQLMAIKNRERSQWVQSPLDLHPDDRVLEIGFGSGVDIRRAAQRVPMGFVAGIDHSEVMLRQAIRRNTDLAIVAPRF